MLRSLSIRDFVIVERLDLEFDRGFTALTGETGAGKSILVDALALALGERVDASAVRQGAERAEVSAEFDMADASALEAWLDEQGLRGDEPACLVRRTVDASGRTRAFINGSAATVAQLREAGEFLVDIHGQHAHQSLLRAPAQRALLDAFAGLDELVARTRARHREWRERRDAREALAANAAAIEAERERLEWQTRELAALEFSLENWAELNGEHARLANAASLIEGAQFALDTLGESDSASLPQLNAVRARLQALVECDPGLREIAEVLDSAGIQIQEAIYGLRRYQQKLDIDPQRLREAEVRIDAVHAACRKYRIQPQAVPETLECCRARLAELQTRGDGDALERLENDARERYIAEATALSAARRKAAAILSREVTTAMHTLAMSGAAFEIALETTDPAAHGLENVEFRLAPHPSVAAQPLAKAASGGELSRVSLAIQSVTSRIAQVPTLVFDEVDAGIGGRVAEIVGRMLKELGRTHQVMCVTHLPQVAAAADHQWQVAKSATPAKVSSRVLALDHEQRIDEIARMLGGVKITETTRRHAAEMLHANEKPG